MKQVPKDLGMQKFLYTGLSKVHAGSTFLTEAKGVSFLSPYVVNN